MKTTSTLPAELLGRQPPSAMRRGDASRSPPSARWRSKGLNLHFVTALYLQGQPLCLGGAGGTVCSCFSNAQSSAPRSHRQAPAYRLPRAGVHCARCHAPCPPPTPHSLGRSSHEGSGRTEFFFSLSVTSSYLTFLRNEGCRQILKVFWRLKTRLGNRAFQRQPDCIFRH